MATSNKHPGSEYHRKAAAHHAAVRHHHLRCPTTARRTSLERPRSAPRRRTDTAGAFIST